MKKVLIIGGGFAGLSAAVRLVDKGINVTLIEASPKLGGRAYSFLNKKQKAILDNGQHILMGCYKNTLEFLDKISALDNFTFQKRMEVNFLKSGSKKLRLKAVSNFYPFNLLLAILQFRAINFGARLKAVVLFVNVIILNKEKLEIISAYDWLLSHRQDAQIIENLWEPIIVSIFNTDSKTVSALSFAKVLKEIFLRGNKAATFVVPNKGLSDSYCKQSAKFIKERNGKICLSEKVVELCEENGAIAKVVTNKRIISDFDYLISAVPIEALTKFGSESLISSLNLPNVNYSPIVTIHIWCKSKLISEQFVGLLNSKIDWVFRHKEHFSLLTSAADEFVNLSDEEIIALVNLELAKYFPNYSNNDLLDYKIIKEKRATFIADIKTELSRQNINEHSFNLFITGDWSNTGLPSTIESAVKSGTIVADKILNLN